MSKTVGVIFVPPDSPGAVLDAGVLRQQRGGAAIGTAPNSNLHPTQPRLLRHSSTHLPSSPTMDRRLGTFKARSAAGWFRRREPVGGRAHRGEADAQMGLVERSDCSSPGVWCAGPLLVSRADTRLLCTGGRDEALAPARTPSAGPPGLRSAQHQLPPRAQLRSRQFSAGSTRVPLRLWSVSRRGCMAADRARLELTARAVHCHPMPSHRTQQRLSRSGCPNLTSPPVVLIPRPPQNSPIHPLPANPDRNPSPSPPPSCPQAPRAPPAAACVTVTLPCARAAASPRLPAIATWTTTASAALLSATPPPPRRPYRRLPRSSLSLSISSTRRTSAPRSVQPLTASHRLHRPSNHHPPLTPTRAALTRARSSWSAGVSSGKSRWCTSASSAARRLL